MIFSIDHKKYSILPEILFYTYQYKVEPEYDVRDTHHACIFNLPNY